MSAELPLPASANHDRARRRWEVVWRAAPAVVSAVLLLLPVEHAGARTQAAVLVALVAGAALVGWRIAGALLAVARASDRALGAALCAVAFCGLLGTLLGAAGALHGSVFRSCMALATLGTLWPARRGGPPASVSRRDARGRPAPPWPCGILRFVLAAAAVAVGWAFVEILDANRHVNPGYFSYDDTSYHLTAVANWTVHHDLRMPRMSSGDPRTPFYPFLCELLAWELTTPFAGGDLAARWVELPFALLSAFALWVLARRCGAGQTALLAPLLYLSVRELYPTLAMSAGTDHAVAFGALATVHGALLLHARPDGRKGAYGGAALGVWLATKYIAVIYAPALVVVLILALWRRPRPRERRGVAVCALLLAAVVTGGYSYIRNAVTAGNPIFPVSVPALGLPGWGVAAMSSVGFGSAAIDPWLFPWTSTDALGSVFRWTALPAAILAPVFALAWAPRGRRTLFAAIFALPATLYALCMLFVEFHEGVRFLAAALALAGLAAAWLVAHLPSWPRTLVAGAMAGAAAWPWVLERPEALIAGLLVAAIGGLWSPRRVPVRAAWHPAAGLAVALLSAVALAPRVRTEYARHRLDAAPCARLLAELGGPRALRVAYVGGNQPYLYAGDHLQNEVLMPPAAAALDAMSYDWGSRTENVFTRPPRRRFWLRNLAVLRVDYVAWADGPGADGPERAWLAADPQRFELVCAVPDAELWRVRPQTGRQAGAPIGPNTAR